MDHLEQGTGANTDTNIDAASTCGCDHNFFTSWLDLPTDLALVLFNRTRSRPRRISFSFIVYCYNIRKFDIYLLTFPFYDIAPPTILTDLIILDMLSYFVSLSKNALLSHICFGCSVILFISQLFHRGVSFVILHTGK